MRHTEYDHEEIKRDKTERDIDYYYDQMSPSSKRNIEKKDLLLRKTLDDSEQDGFASQTEAIDPLTQ